MEKLTLEDIQRASDNQTNKPWGFLGHACRNKGLRCDRIFLEACNEWELDYAQMVLVGESRIGRHLGDYLESNLDEKDKYLIVDTTDYIAEALHEIKEAQEQEETKMEETKRWQDEPKDEPIAQVELKNEDGEVIDADGIYTCHGQEIKDCVQGLIAVNGLKSFDKCILNDVRGEGSMLKLTDGKAILFIEGRYLETHETIDFNKYL